MNMQQSLSYDDCGRLYLDRWSVPIEDEDFAEPDLFESVILGPIDAPETAAIVPDSLRKTHAVLLAQWADEKAGREPWKTGHVHTASCYDDPGPGHGSPFLVCGKVAGEP